MLALAFASTVRFTIQPVFFFWLVQIGFRGGHSGEVTPGSVPIPVAKLASADGTALFSVGE